MRARIIEAEGGGSVDFTAGGAPISLGTGRRAAISEPFEIDFRTVGEFYHKIETGFLHIPEHELFIGPRDAQASARYVDLSGELVAVVDRASACSAIDMIIEQGEAPSAAHPDAHFVVFDTIRMEYSREVESARARGEAFDPVRPVVSNPMTRFYDDTSGGTIITDPLTHEVAELFNISYDTMLLMLLRFLAHTEETEPELEHLSRATLRLMATVLRPLGEALAMMPVGDPLLPGRTAGPGFGYNRDVHLLPHKASAWVFFAERLRGLAVTAATLRKRAGVPRQVDEAAAALEDLATQFAPSDRSWNRAAEVKQFARIDTGKAPAITPELNGPYLVTNVENLVNSKGERLEARPRMALCRCGGSANKPFCDGTHARIGFTSAKAPDRVADHRDTYTSRGTDGVRQSRYLSTRRVLHGRARLRYSGSTPSPSSTSAPQTRKRSSRQCGGVPPVRSATHSTVSNTAIRSVSPRSRFPRMARTASLAVWRSPASHGPRVPQPSITRCAGVEGRRTSPSAMVRTGTSSSATTRTRGNSAA